MFNALLFPANILIALGFCSLISLDSLSNLYSSPDDYAILALSVMLSIYGAFCVFMFRRAKPFVDASGEMAKKFSPFLKIAACGFIVEFALYGIPLLLKGGRDDYTGIPVLHVVFYSSAIISVLFASLYASNKNIAITLLFAAAISVLTLSRQMMMVSFCIFIIASLIRYRMTKKIALRLFLLIFILFASFGFVGDIRQQMSGDYVNNYIFLVGGANAGGEALGSSLYWLWIYMATPVYNLIHNLHDYNVYGSFCGPTDTIGTCNGSYISTVLIPNTIAKYLGEPEFKISLEVPYLNAGTGYAAAARLLGLPGVIIQLFAQFAYYFVGRIVTPIRMRTAYTVYFSALSVFMIFDDLYTHGEFFFGFLLIIIANTKVKFPFSISMNLRPR